MKNVLVCLLGLGLMTASIVKADPTAPEASVPSTVAGPGQPALSEGAPVVAGGGVAIKVCPACTVDAKLGDNTTAEPSTASSGATGTKVEPTK